MYVAPRLDRNNVLTCVINTPIGLVLGNLNNTCANPLHWCLVKSQRTEPFDHSGPLIDSHGVLFVDLLASVLWTWLTVSDYLFSDREREWTKVETV